MSLSWTAGCSIQVTDDDTNSSSRDPADCLIFDANFYFGILHESEYDAPCELDNL